MGHVRDRGGEREGEHRKPGWLLSPGKMYGMSSFLKRAKANVANR